MHITICRSIVLHQGHVCSPRNMSLQTSHLVVGGGHSETAEGIYWVEAEGGTHPTEHTAALTAHSRRLQNLNIPEVERTRLPYTTKQIIKKFIVCKLTEIVNITLKQFIYPKARRKGFKETMLRRNTK